MYYIYLNYTLFVTVFAYGQTGSGKTFTLTGGPEKYSDRGLIPRSISMLYSGVIISNYYDDCLFYLLHKITIIIIPFHRISKPN